MNADITLYSNGHAAMHGFLFSKLSGQGNAGVIKILIGGSQITLHMQTENEFKTFCQQHNIHYQHNNTQPEVTP